MRSGKFPAFRVLPAFRAGFVCSVLGRMRSENQPGTSRESAVKK